MRVRFKVRIVLHKSIGLALFRRPLFSGNLQPAVTISPAFTILACRLGTNDPALASFVDVAPQFEESPEMA